MDKKRKRYKTVGMDLRDEWKTDEDTQQVYHLADQLQTINIKKTTENHTQTSAINKILNEKFERRILSSVPATTS